MLDLIGFKPSKPGAKPLSFVIGVIGGCATCLWTPGAPEANANTPELLLKLSISRPETANLDPAGGSPDLPATDTCVYAAREFVSRASCIR